MTNSTSKSTSTPKSRIMPSRELKDVPPFAKPPRRHGDRNSRVVGPTKERMEQFEDTIKVRPPAHTMYHAARSYRIPNPNVKGKDINMEEVYRRAASHQDRRDGRIKPSSLASFPTNKKMGVEEQVRRWDVSSALPARSRSPDPSPPPPPYKSSPTSSQRGPPSYKSFDDTKQQDLRSAPTAIRTPSPSPAPAASQDAGQAPYSPSPPPTTRTPALNPITQSPARQDTHPPPQPHAKAYPSSPSPPMRIITPIPQSLRPNLPGSGLKTPRTPYTHEPIHDTSSYAPTSSSSEGDGADGGDDDDDDDDNSTIKGCEWPLPPPTTTSIESKYLGYRFVGPITSQAPSQPQIPSQTPSELPSHPPYSSSKAEKRKGKARAKVEGEVRFESEVEVRTFGKDEEPRRAIKGREAVVKWMGGEGWGDWDAGPKMK